MNTDMTIAVVLLAGAVAFLVTMSLWCRSIINQMAQQGYKTARETMKDKNR